MNYQINLFAFEELRSGAPVSKKFLVRLAVAIVAGLLVLGIVALVASAQIKQSNMQALKTQWSAIDKNQKKVKKIEDDKKKIEPLAADAEGWRASRCAWSEVLADLPAMTTETMQITQLLLNERLDSTPARCFTMLLYGKVGGDFPDRDIRTLQENLRNTPSFKDIIENVEVKRYDPDVVQGSDLKVFTIECRFKPRPLQP